ncbi:TPA: hypothetical protein SMS08_000191 [Proteus mirabilis]|uniref:hypothetical protein n=1 Tax=Proteus mirabilis TaxID=584 RepID=UPI0018C4EF1A|nr:hypothetical protein [Proteus mirabilis]MBG2791863.1 hypothetical protein [Proteus mirabilis]MBG2823928.1 hypothetical protein [Proteus mirabilis]HCR3457222.1 hypothetical protein [Proteus mirabilis]HCU0049351.1 hypothetical protein [Proteus mirabilis]HEK2034017.1 hypothetical protein [Proteus mirabilis]
MCNVRKLKLSTIEQIAIAFGILLVLLLFIFCIGPIWTNSIVLVGSVVLYLCSVTQRGDENINTQGILSLSFIFLSGANLIKDIIKENELPQEGIFFVLIAFIIPMVLFFFILLVAFLLKCYADNKLKQKQNTSNDQL